MSRQAAVVEFLSINPNKAYTTREIAAAVGERTSNGLRGVQQVLSNLSCDYDWVIRVGNGKYMLYDDTLEDAPERPPEYQGIVAEIVGILRSHPNGSLTSADVARIMGIKTNTVSTQLGQIRKAGVNVVSKQVLFLEDEDV